MSRMTAAPAEIPGIACPAAFRAVPYAAFTNCKACGQDENNSKGKALTSGLINQTYLVKTADENEPNYVLQRINNNIFCDVDMLQYHKEIIFNQQKIIKKTLFSPWWDLTRQTHG